MIIVVYDGLESSIPAFFHPVRVFSSGKSLELANLNRDKKIYCTRFRLSTRDGYKMLIL